MRVRLSIVSSVSSLSSLLLTLPLVLLLTIVGTSAHSRGIATVEDIANHYDALLQTPMSIDEKIRRIVKSLDWVQVVGPESYDDANAITNIYFENLDLGFVNPDCRAGHGEFSIEFTEKRLLPVLHEETPSLTQLEKMEGLKLDLDRARPIPSQVNLKAKNLGEVRQEWEGRTDGILILAGAANTRVIRDAVPDPAGNGFRRQSITEAKIQYFVIDFYRKRWIEGSYRHVFDLDRSSIPSPPTSDDNENTDYVCGGELSHSVPDVLRYIGGNDHMESALYWDQMSELFRGNGWDVDGNGKQSSSDLRANRNDSLRQMEGVVMIISDEERPLFGTGFYIRKNLILTNYHVIEVDEKPREYVRILNSRADRFLGAVISYDRNRDLALLRPQRNAERVAALHDGSNLSVGDEVYAVGNPWGRKFIVSRGVISGFFPDHGGECRGLSVCQYINSDLIVIDAPISKGSSGGAGGCRRRR